MIADAFSLMVLMSVRRSSLRRYAPAAATLRYLSSSVTTRLFMARKTVYQGTQRLSEAHPTLHTWTGLNTLTGPQGPRQLGHFRQILGTALPAREPHHIPTLVFPRGEALEGRGRGQRRVDDHVRKARPRRPYFLWTEVGQVIPLAEHLAGFTDGVSLCEAGQPKPLGFDHGDALGRPVPLTVELCYQIFCDVFGNVTSYLSDSTDSIP